MWVMLTVNSGFRVSPTLGLCPTNLVEVCKPRNCSALIMVPCTYNLRWKLILHWRLFLTELL
jgi:hypothetical protein